MYEQAYINYGPRFSNGVNQRQVCDKVQGVRAIVVVGKDDGEKHGFLEDDYLGVTRIPLRPGDPGSETDLAVRVEIVDKPNDVVPEFSLLDVIDQNRVQEIRPVSLRKWGGKK
jgi:hypothetical protein